MSTNLSFSRGARGHIVRSIQAAAGMKPNDVDGTFGGKTEGAVKQFWQSHGHEPKLFCDREFFELANLKWPSLFDRCLCITNGMEGTDFGEANETDFDKAGVTLGVIGFTTKHGEVQKLVSNFLKQFPAAYDCVTSGTRRNQLRLLADGNNSAVLWNNWFYAPNGRIRDDAKIALEWWGANALFRELQIQMAIKGYWEPAERKVKEFGLTSAAAYGLMFDVWVQNGGWRRSHQWAFEKKDSKTLSERQRLEYMAEVVGSQANPEWRDDVKARKMVFATGRGIVHEATFSLKAQALA